MPKEISQVFARRARLSSKAIVTAIVLTLAALAAMLVASRQETKISIRKADTGASRVSGETGSNYTPVINR